MALSSPSRRDTLALAGLGVVAVGESGVRMAARPARAVWDSRLLGPARWLAAPGLDRLVRRGQQEQLRLQALAHGGVTELAVGVVVDHSLVERAVAELLRAGVLEGVADQIASSPLPVHLVEDALTEGVAEPLIGALLESPALTRVIDQVLASPELERLVVRVMESGLVDQLTDRLLDSDQLQRVVAHIARSPEVRAALTAQSAGLAGELAGEVRSRTTVADDAAERVARRLLGRRAIRRDGAAAEPG
jgi:hypothetical protein